MPKPESALLSKLIKLLNMTTSPNQGEALSAAAMANALVAKLGTTWDELLTGKVTLIADPFTSIPEPPKSTSTPPPPTGRYSPPPPRPQPAPPPPQSGGTINPRPIYTHQCAQCGSHFHSTTLNPTGVQSFCSSFCATAHASKTPSVHNHFCHQCGKQYTSATRSPAIPYCSTACMTAATTQPKPKPRPTVRRKGKQIPNPSDLLKGF